MTDIFAEFERRIAVKKRELDEEERALAVLKRTMAQDFGQPESGDGQAWSETFKFEELIGSVEKSKKRTLVDDVRDVVSKFGLNEFTIAHVDAGLGKMGVVVNAKSPRARMSLALGKLVDEGFIVMTFKGAGNVPNRYKLNEGSSLL